MHAAALVVLACLSALAAGMKGPETRKILGIDPRMLTAYTEAELSKFYPPETKLSMGPAPGEIFSTWDKLLKVTIPEAPVIP
jgi:hypothetical protein